jgi:cytochrome c biogenesis protein CcdA
LSLNIVGPDHLAAILPSSVGLDGWFGMRIGAIWGLGHGMSAILIGAVAFLLKGTVTSRFKFIETLSSLAENAVGFSLIVIGLLGLKENMFDSDSVSAVEDSEKPRNFSAIFLNGVLHGFSWDGAPSLAPAVTMTSWSATMGFLLSYCLGTVVTMSIASGILSEGSKRIGSVTGNPNASKNLSIGSSVVAVMLGLYWVLKSKFK